MTDWVALSWPDASLPEAIASFARGARRSTPDARTAPEAARDDEARERWVDALAAAHRLNAEPVECLYGELESALARLGPSVIPLRVAGETRWLAVRSSSRRALRVWTPQRTVRVVRPADLRSSLCAELDTSSSRRIDRWLATAGVPRRRARRAHARILAETLGDRWIGPMWVLRPDPGASFARQLAGAQILRRALVFAAASGLQVVIAVLGWVMLGRGALEARIDPGWLVAWALLSLSAVPVQLLASGAAGRIGIDLATRLKQRLLAGALRIDVEAVRGLGSGQLLGMVNESEAVETAALGGALNAIVALVQLAAAAVVLYMGAGGVLHLALLLAWSAVVAGLAVTLGRRRAEWTSTRLEMTNTFVENVVGHRTRVAQQPREERHELEDEALEGYVARARAMDRAQQTIAAVPARGWLVLGFLGLAPSIALSQPDPVSVLLAIGGILQAQGAFSGIVASLLQLLGGVVAWKSIGRLFQAAARFEPAALSFAAAPSTPPRGTDPERPTVLSMRSVSFRYREDAEPALLGCDLTLRAGDRVLLEGASGSGKSTLAAVMCGRHTPNAGLVLLRGLDKSTLGATGWRRGVASAPQFHENYVLTGTLAFNLLMGRRWPPSEQDKREAEALCRELGLGPMLDKMPSGLDQVVGETGWQLSHGERSRIFLARALLQRAELVVLDESFGALDPLTLRTCLETALARAPTLVIIAHP